MRYDIRLRHFWRFNYLVLFIALLVIGRHGLAGMTAPFVLAVAAGYALLFLALPALVAWLARLVPGLRRHRHWAGATVMALLLLLLWADTMIYGMYGFHLNGFVWNLVITPGGIESLGGGASTWLALVVLAAMLFGLQALLWWAAGRERVAAATRWLPAGRVAVALLLTLMVGERLAYGISHYTAYRPVLRAASAMPFYQPTTFRSFADSLGFQQARAAGLSVDAEGRLHYPLAPLEVADDAPTPDVLWLVAESLRGDMLTPEIMPNVWRFAAERGHRFTNHYSGGNGTRMGIFSMFYGLPGSYWFAFLDERQPPLLVSELQRRNYRFGLYTSARFTYPEFDKTVWATIPREAMTEDSRGEGWERDRRNVDRLLDFFRDADRSRPLFGFMFFESAHAPYTFAPDTVIRDDYLKDFNYATADIAGSIGQIFNRYVNAAHHVDQQIGRLLDELERSGRLENTIVVITGDHGEEFMENGRWGHNSEFHHEQIFTPLVLAGPGIERGVTDAPTSHLDIVPTLMPLLGVTSPAGTYADGISLFSPQPGRYRLVASWDALGYIGPEYKVGLPLRAGGLRETAVLEVDDDPVADVERVMAELQPALRMVLADMAQFFRPRG